MARLAGENKKGFRQKMNDMLVYLGIAAIYLLPRIIGAAIALAAVFYLFRIIVMR